MGLLPGEAFSNVDAAWLHMEDRTNLMTITGVLSFYEKLEFAKLKEVIEDRFLSYDRFRQRVVKPSVPFAGPRWVEDRYFNLNSHLLRVALPDPGGQDELQEMVGNLMSTPWIHPSRCGSSNTSRTIAVVRQSWLGSITASRMGSLW